MHLDTHNRYLQGDAANIATHLLAWSNPCTAAARKLPLCAGSPYVACYTALALRGVQAVADSLFCICLAVDEGHHHTISTQAAHKTGQMQPQLRPAVGLMQRHMAHYVVCGWSLPYGWVHGAACSGLCLCEGCLQPCKLVLLQLQNKQIISINARLATERTSVAV